MLDHGLIDLHTHMIPQMDDGSPGEFVSVEMLRRDAAARKLGQERLAAIDRNAAQLIGRAAEQAAP